MALPAYGGRGFGGGQPALKSVFRLSFGSEPDGPTETPITVHSGCCCSNDPKLKQCTEVACDNGQGSKLTCDGCSPTLTCQ